ncbi:MAG: hypothetical protein RL748_736, partial [Pseudomonadota bacterium]
MINLLRSMFLLCVLALGHVSALAVSLNVALYPYVPRPQQFQAAVTAAWSRVEPGVTLNFISDESKWDGGYSTDPAADIDVFVFDAMYL